MKKLLLLFSLAAFSIGHAQIANDECTSAIGLTVNTDIICASSTTGDLTSATSSAEFDCNGGVISNDLWYSFTASAAAHTMTLTTNGEAEPMFALYSGACGALENMQCGVSGPTVLGNLTSGQMYYIRIISPENLATSFTICLTTLPPVISIDTNYTAEQLVNDVLINSSCLSISNISMSTGTNFGGLSGIGYYEQNGSSFSSEYGVVLSTGNAVNLPGPATGAASSGSTNWIGDTDLAAVIAGTGQFGGSYNASSLEFDFVPSIEHISFDFLFASNEYGTFQCSFADAFAFILTDLTTGVETNLAVVPGSVIPVSVTTIRNSLYNSACPSANAQYFDEYYGNSPLAPINMKGITVPMTAQSPVIPGNPYHIKLVIADYMDAAFDSAVFIDAGSFNIGSPEYAELSLSNGSILCNGQSTTINISLGETFPFEWSLNGTVIPGAISNSFVATEAGVYTVAVTLPSGCVLEYSVNIVEGDALGSTSLPDYIIFEPSSDGLAEFDLSTQTTAIIGDAPAADFTISYHLSLEDAQQSINPLLNFYTNIDNPQTVFVSIVNAQSGCFTIKTLRLIVVDENFVAPAPSGAADQDFAPGATLADIVVEGENIQWYDNPGDAAGRDTNDNDDTPLPTSTVLVDNTTYYASQTIYGIESIERLAVTVHLTMGTTGNTFNAFNYYPNPVKDVLTLSNKENIEEVVIYNLLGQAVFSKTINERTTSLNLSSVIGGIYIVKVTSEDVEKTFKILKE